MASPVAAKVLDLHILYGFILETLNNGTEARVSWDKTDPAKRHHEKLPLDSTMTLDDLKELASARILEIWDIDLRKLSKENGGPGFTSEISCEVDVEDAKRNFKLTRMSIPNEGSWTAAKVLFGLAEGEIKLEFLFAVDQGNFWDRFLVKLFT